ncbi:MAG: bifunctional tetrahydrofolate synthase/dihydrofolate synthase [Sulfuriflexus sp.]|nr:bifunctional tetrahydrofolate synthase/dihydrofolate synthase [Sulfuriflexus sp.]
MESHITLQQCGCGSGKSLQEWLDWLETLHPQEIELGLDRVRDVFKKQSLAPLARKVIVVAGTNGKGSTIALLEAMLLSAGYSVGSYTSPHLNYYNERVRIGGIDMSDSSLCGAFSRVEQARGETSLSYFEFGTLAAFDLFSRHKLDIVLLEVGLGGRLDAVNIIDADVSVITNIDIDHEEWLGSDREVIGFEKAGVMRPKTVTIFGERDVPKSIRDAASKIGAQLHILGEDFDFQREAESWQWTSGDGALIDSLPQPALAGECQFTNAAVAIAVLQQLLDFPVDGFDIIEGLAAVQCRGRYEITEDDSHCIFDVAHNPASVAALSRTLTAQAISGRTHIVFGVMADKDIAAMVAELADVADDWYLAAPEIPRAAEPAAVEAVCINSGIEVEALKQFTSVSEATEQALRDCAENDRVVVCGSFYTVAEAMRHVD